MIRLPEWELCDDGYCNKVGVYRLYLKKREGRWQLEIWEQYTEARLITEYHFTTTEVDSLQRIAFDCLNNILRQIR